jgi:ABC-type phosphate/phosphonate transport system permease subunit
MTLIDTIKQTIIAALLGGVVASLLAVALTVQTISNDCIHVGKWRTGDLVFECRPVEKAK